MGSVRYFWGVILGSVWFGSLTFPIPNLPPDVPYSTNLDKRKNIKKSLLARLGITGITR